MTETYRAAIAAAKERYKEAMEGAAADVIYIYRQYKKPRAAVCKEIAGDGWGALDKRSRDLEKRAGQTPDEARLAARKRALVAERTHARSILKNPEEAAKVIASLPPAALDEVYHEARLARAGEDRSPANRKAATAASREAVAPLKRAAATTHAALGIAALREARDDIGNAIEEGAMTPHQLQVADGLVNEIANLLMEAKFAEGAAR